MFFHGPRRRPDQPPEESAPDLASDLDAQTASAAAENRKNARDGVVTSVIALALLGAAIQIASLSSKLDKATTTARLGAACVVIEGAQTDLGELGVSPLLAIIDNQTVEGGPVMHPGRVYDAAVRVDAALGVYSDGNAILPGDIAGAELLHLKDIVDQAALLTADALDIPVEDPDDPTYVNQYFLAAAFTSLEALDRARLETGVFINRNCDEQK